MWDRAGPRARGIPTAVRGLREDELRQGQAAEPRTARGTRGTGRGRGSQ